MKSKSIGLLHFFFVATLAAATTVACGGGAATSSDPEQVPGAGQPAASSPQKDPPAAPPSSSSTTLKEPPKVSTVLFKPTVVYAERSSANAKCMEKNVPFASADHYSLQPVQGTGPWDKIKSIALAFTGTVSLNTPLHLVDGPGGPATIEGAQHAHSPDMTTGVELIAFGPDTGTDKPPTITTPFDQATVTVTNLPTKEGEPLTARVELHFTDGKILDAVYTAPIKSSPGACGK